MTYHVTYADSLTKVERSYKSPSRADREIARRLKEGRPVNVSYDVGEIETRTVTYFPDGTALAVSVRTSKRLSGARFPEQRRVFALAGIKCPEESV